MEELSSKESIAELLAMVQALRRISDDLREAEGRIQWTEEYWHAILHILPPEEREEVQNTRKRLFEARNRLFEARDRKLHEIECVAARLADDSPGVLKLLGEELPRAEAEGRVLDVVASVFFVIAAGGVGAGVLAETRQIWAAVTAALVFMQVWRNFRFRTIRDTPRLRLPPGMQPAPRPKILSLQ